MQRQFHSPFPCIIVLYLSWHCHILKIKQILRPYRSVHLLLHYNLNWHTTHIPSRFQKQLTLQLIQDIKYYISGNRAEIIFKLTHEIPLQYLYVEVCPLHSVHNTSLGLSKYSFYYIHTLWSILYFAIFLNVIMSGYLIYVLIIYSIYLQ